MFHVVRTHSHTYKQLLWKVMSRPMKSFDSCVAWRDFCESDYRETNPNGKHKFFVVKIEDSV